MAKIITVDGVDYAAYNKRMVYNPEYHFNHGTPWIMKDVLYLCGMWDVQKARDISLALGRTENTCMNKVYELRKAGKFEEYKKMFRK